MIIAAALIAMALAGQPAKSPEKQGVSKGNSTQGATQAESPTKTKQQSKPEASAARNVSAETSDTHAQQRDEQIEIERRVEVFTGLLVVAAFLQAGIFFWQGRVFRRTLNAINRQADIYQQQVTQMVAAGKQTDQLLDTMRDTAMCEQRAYVCIGAAKIGFVQERAPEIHVRIKNYGNTPAYNVRMWIGTALGACPIPANVSLQQRPDSLRMSTSVLAPGAKPHTMIVKHPEIAEVGMPIIGTPELTLYVYGEIKYLDAFKKERTTRYRLMFGGTTNHVLKLEKGIPVALLRPDAEGNEAD